MKNKDSMQEVYEEREHNEKRLCEINRLLAETEDLAVREAYETLKMELLERM